MEQMYHKKVTKSTTMVKFKTDPSNDAPEGPHHVTWGEGGGTRKVQFQTPPALKIVGNFYYGFVGGDPRP